MRGSRRWLQMVVAAGALALAGCAGGEDEARQSLTRFARATADGDGRTACSLVSGEAAGAIGALARKRLTRCEQFVAEAATNLPEETRRRLRERAVERVSVEGDAATAHLLGQEVTLRRRGERWRLDVGAETVWGDPEDHEVVVVAKIAGKPITRQTFDRWSRIAAAADRRAIGRSVRQPSREGRRRLRDRVMQFLLPLRWIEGEAARQGITAADAEVQDAFDKQKQAAFRSDREYERFLRESAQTEQDVLARVRLDLLSEKIREQVVGARRGADAQKALDAFVRDFRRRWKERTVCAEGYITIDCRNARAGDEQSAGGLGRLLPGGGP